MHTFKQKIIWLTGSEGLLKGLVAWLLTIIVVSVPMCFVSISDGSFNLIDGFVFSLIFSAIILIPVGTIVLFARVLMKREFLKGLVVIIFSAVIYVPVLTAALLGHIAILASGSGKQTDGEVNNYGRNAFAKYIGVDLASTDAVVDYNEFGFPDVVRRTIIKSSRAKQIFDSLSTSQDERGTYQNERLDWVCNYVDTVTKGRKIELQKACDLVKNKPLKFWKTQTIKQNQLMSDTYVIIAEPYLILEYGTY